MWKPLETSSRSKKDLRTRRSLLCALLLAPLACTVATSVSEQPTNVPSPSGDSGTDPELDPSVTDASVDAGVGSVRVALFGGFAISWRVDAGRNKQNEVPETMLTSIAADGTVGPITFDSAPPPGGPWTAASLQNGTVYLHNFYHIVYAGFTGHVTTAWMPMNWPAEWPAGSGWLLTPRGFESGSTPDSNGASFFAPFEGDGGLGAWTQVSNHTAPPDVSTFLQVGDKVYAVGGEPGVTMTTRTPTGDLGEFVPTSSAPKVDGYGAPVLVSNGDFIFRVARYDNPADFVLAAPITASGALDPWARLPSLPSKRTGFAAVATKSWLFVFGGLGPTLEGDPTDDILRLAIHADGSFGTAWEKAGSLPAPRAGLVAITY